jgi:uncharacterized protein (TIGR00725 family)
MAGIVTIFGSSAPRPGSEDYATAYECGKMLAEAGFAICNGGYAGTMEAAAKGARASGGKTIGVTVSSWPAKANEWVQQEIKAADLPERLAKLIELGDAYIVLRGGSGTLLEFAYVLELVNKDIIQNKPIVLLGDSWKGVINALRQEPASDRQKDFSRLVHTVGSPAELIRYLEGIFKPRM